MSKEKNIKTNELFKQDRFLSILVHLLTGFGIVAGFFALILLILIKDLNINPVYEVFLMFLWVVSNIYFISASIFKTFRN